MHYQSRWISEEFESCSGYVFSSSLLNLTLTSFFRCPVSFSLPLSSLKQFYSLLQLFVPLVKMLHRKRKRVEMVQNGGSETGKKTKQKNNNKNPYEKDLLCPLNWQRQSECCHGRSRPFGSEGEESLYSPRHPQGLWGPPGLASQWLPCKTPRARGSAWHQAGAHTHWPDE